MLNISAGFTKSASKALLQAQLCAAAMGCPRMASGHLLLGLARGGDELTQCFPNRIALSAHLLQKCNGKDANTLPLLAQNAQNPVRFLAET